MPLQEAAAGRAHARDWGIAFETADPGPSDSRVTPALVAGLLLTAGSRETHPMSRRRFRVVRTSLLFISLVTAIITAENARAVQLTMSWADNTNGIAWTRVERRLEGGQAFIPLADLAPGVTTYVDTALHPGTKYCYRLIAYNAESVSPYSDEACATSPSDHDPTFVDVPPTHPFFVWIEALASSGVAAGCSKNPPQFCPDDGTSRREMAVLLLRALHGAGYQPPAATGIFADVATSDSLAAWIEQLARDGITGGCSSNPLLYCPDTMVTRAELAVFLSRTMHGAGYVPPAPTGTMFTDVPRTHPFAPWVEQLASDGITGGCLSLPARYCPEDPVTRGQMAALLVRAFNIPL